MAYTCVCKMGVCVLTLWGLTPRFQQTVDTPPSALVVAVSVCHFSRLVRGFVVQHLIRYPTFPLSRDPGARRAASTM